MFARTLSRSALEHGQIAERGTHEELLAAGGRYYELYRDWSAQTAA